MAQDASPTSGFDADVVIVGLGPVGATLANLLGLCGVRTLVLEREAEAYHLPRAVHFDDEVMRVFETIGLSDQIARDVVLSPGMHFVDTNGALILDWSRPAEISPLGWYPSYRFHQPDLERVLRDGLAQWPGVTVRNHCEVFAIDSGDAGATVRFEDLATGRLLRSRAMYVVGCDGARSIVRRLIGSGLDDLGFHERWLVVDVMLKRPRPDLGDYTVQHCDPARPVTYVRGTGNRRSWEITLRDGEDSQAMTSPARVWDLLGKWVGPNDADIERAAVYTFHSAITERWRNGRLLLAGDSAHQTPPFLGQGMCAGIRDAANLAWKLCRVVGGKTDDALLDSYQSERAPHVREYIDLAIKLGGIINTKAINAGLSESERGTSDPARMETTKPKLGPGLSVGEVAITGQLVPQPRLTDGRRLDAYTGYRFAILMTPRLYAKLSGTALRQLHESGVAVVDDASPELQSWLERQELEAVLARPDRYALGGARNHVELQGLLSAIGAPLD
jgi:3-(3-hydroxy-phenyl)propionate hydroxylase